jgi:hypothetical protein
MAQFDRFDIVEAHCVLEWDYNLGGWLHERPSNQRRRASTGVQLHRMKFRARADLCFDNLSENGQEIYLGNVLKLGLPRDAEMDNRIQTLFSADWLATTYPGIRFAEAHA